MHTVTTNGEPLFQVDFSNSVFVRREPQASHECVADAREQGERLFP